MRANLLIIIIISAFIAVYPVHSADGPASGWIKGALVEVLADKSVKEVDEYGDHRRPIGFPAFRKLAIRKDEKADRWSRRWTVTGTVCSTNSGTPVQGAAIYLGYPNGRFILVAMSNRIGEVFFSASAIWTSSDEPIEPTHLFIANDPVPLPSLKGETLRQYLMRVTE